MSTSKVYFTDMRSSAKENLLAKVVRLADRLDLKQIVPPRGLVAKHGGIPLSNVQNRAYFEKIIKKLVTQHRIKLKK